MEHVFPPSDTPVGFCLLERPYGTVVTVTVDDFGACRLDGRTYRSHHLCLDGGQASSETGYRSHYFHDPNPAINEGELVRFALLYAEERFNELHPRRQLDLFQ